MAPAIASVVTKEAMFRYTLKVGKRNNSLAVIANAWNHRSDAYSSVAALAGIVAARLAFEYLDPIAGLVVSALIINKLKIQKLQAHNCYLLKRECSMK
jgi:divalent metal cation (Fe/Co/Zn/Cd) transporter